jgi:tRNA pseudouridine38-40 synthase
VVEYDGTRFYGFQRQPQLPTVQGELEGRLSRICGHPVEVVGAGRTDVGVHALGQVIHFDTTGRIPACRVASAVNSLGVDLLVRRVEEVGPEFHARFSAVERTYHYFITRRSASPFLAPFSAGEGRLVGDAADRMRTALLPLLGRHDFRAFAAAGSDRSTIRTVLGAGVAERGEILRVELTADGFVRSMVRIIVGWLLEIGRGAKSPEMLGEALYEATGPGAVTAAPARGLFLVSAAYGDGFPDPALLEEMKAWWPGSR